jgi:ribosomal protein S6--L-glutamate ligase
MRWLTPIVFGMFFLNHSSPECFAQFAKEKTVIGRVEWAELPDLKLRFRSRIDSGAKTTSLHALQVEEFQRDGATWVKFRVDGRDGKVTEATRKVESTIKVANPSGFTSKRYVIRERVKLGPVTKEISVNLNDRSAMDYRFLVGRNLLIGNFLVDVARSHVLGD